MTTHAHDRRTFLVAGASAMIALALRPVHGQSAVPAGMTLAKASALLRSKAVSSVELTRASLERIVTYNPSLNAFVTVTMEGALGAARQMDAEWRRGNWRGPLHGIPLAVKDNMDTAGVRTTGASELFKDRVPSEDAEIVRRLKGAGAILLGKTNLHEFAYGGSSSVSYFGPVRNPWALDHVPGGSSGGSAAAGPLCKTVEDTALLLGAISGFDALDPTSVDVPVPDYARALRTRVENVRLGAPRTMFFEGLDPEISAAVDAALDVLRTLTRSLTDVQLPSTGNLLREIMGPEGYAYHSRWLRESPEKYQPQTRERIVQFGTAVTTEAYVQARRQCDVLRREIRKTFRGRRSPRHADHGGAAIIDGTHRAERQPRSGEDSEHMAL